MLVLLFTIVVLMVSEVSLRSACPPRAGSSATAELLQAAKRVFQRVL